MAQLIWHRHLDNPRELNGKRDAMNGAYLGPSYTGDEIAETMKQFGAKYEVLERDELLDKAARVMAEGNVLGWFNGRMEFGPRALGSRSILGDPRSAEMQTKMNLKRNLKIKKLKLNLRKLLKKH